MAGVWLYGYKAAMQEAYHVAYRVHCRHLTIDGAVVAEQFHLMRQVHVIAHAVRLVGELLLKCFIALCLMRDILNEP